MLHSFTIVFIGKEETLGIIEVVRATWFEPSLLWKLRAFRIIYFMSENESGIVPELYILGVVGFVVKRGGIVRD